MVRGKLQLEPLPGPDLGRHAIDTGVVDQEIDRITSLKQAIGKGANRIEIGQIQEFEPIFSVGKLAGKIVARFLSGLGIAASQDDLEAAPLECPGCLRTYPPIRPG